MSGRAIPFSPEPVLGTKLKSIGLEPEVTTVLISDTALLPSGLQQVLQGTPFDVAAAASFTGPGWLQQLALQPALVIIDASQGTEHVLKVVSEVRRHSQQVRIVVLGTQFNLDFVRLWHEAGVDGFCVAANTPEVLIKSLELVMLGESVMPSEVLRSFMDAVPQNLDHPLHGKSAEPRLSDATACKLSTREAQILSCLREGAPNKAIARKLDVTEATIKVHIKAILRKIGVINRTQAAMWATTHLPLRGQAVQHP
jgi:two-component system, NarL family, nitrate/nitrite response regulator NarL